MKQTKQQIQDKINKLQEELKEIEAQEEAEKAKDFQELTFKGDIYRIYKWENKSFKDFPIPKGFSWCPAIDLINLINESDFEFEKYPVLYYADKLFRKSYWELFRACLGRYSGWYANVGDLANSVGNGRVVVKEGKK